MNEDFKKVLDCPGLIFVKDRKSLEDWKIEDSSKYIPIYNVENKAVYKNEDIKQALITMRDVSQLFTTPTKEITVNGVKITQENIETVAMLDIHHESFGKNFFEEIKYKKTMDFSQRNKVMYYGNSIKSLGEGAYVQSKDAYDLTLLIGWSYAILKWYSEYGKAKGWGEKYKGRNFVKFIAQQTPEYFAISDNIVSLFNSHGERENTVYMTDTSYIGRNGEGHVPMVPLKRNLKDHKDQLPGKDRYWVSDVVTLQLQGMTPNYSPFGPYSSEYNEISTHAKVNHWWYRRDYWGVHTLYGIAPGTYGNEKSGPWRPKELRGLAFERDSTQQMPYTYYEAENGCGQAASVFSKATAYTERKKDVNNYKNPGCGVYSSKYSWNDAAQQISRDRSYSGNPNSETYVWHKQEGYRYLGNNEPHIHMIFGHKKTWSRDMVLPCFKHTAGKKDINSEQFVDGKDAPYIDGIGAQDEELLLFFGKYPTKDLGSDGGFGDFGRDLQGSDSANYTWTHFGGSHGLMTLINTNPYSAEADDSAVYAPYKPWWQYKWVHAVRAENFDALDADNRPGVNLAYGSILNPYFGVQFCGELNSTFRAIFVLTAQVITWFYELGDKVDFSQMQDLLGGNGTDAIWENYLFLQAFVTRLVLNAKLTHNKIEQIRKNNTQLAKSDPSQVVVNEQEVKTRLQDNAQCVLINAASTFQEKRANDEAYAGQHTNPVYYNIINGNCSSFINLLGFKKDVIETFLNLKSNEAALLQPRIRLFKQRSNPQTGGGEWVTVDVPGPFETGLNKKSVRKILEGGGGRLPGCGIKEVYMEQRDGNAAVNLIETKDVEITFHFNSLEEIFLNYPAFNGDSSKPSYPFGKTPGVREGSDGMLPVSSVAELVFPISTGFSSGQIRLQDFDNRANPDFRIILELGWSMPGSLFTDMGIIGRGAKNFIKKIQKQNPYQSIVLMPYDSEFNITQNGLVELKVKYRGIEENVVSSPENRLFPNASGLLAKLEGDEADLPDGLKQISSQIKENIKTIKNLKDKRKKKDAAVLTHEERTNLQKAESKVNSLLAEAQEKQLENFLDADIQGLYKDLIDSGMYHRIAIPSALLGKTQEFENAEGEKVVGVVKYIPNRATDELKNFKVNKEEPTGANSKASIIDQVESRIRKAKITTQRKNNNKIKEGEDKGKLDKSDDTTLAAEIGKNLRDSFFAGSGDDFSEPVDFMYFGDILYIIYARLAKMNASKGSMDYNDWLNNKVTFILGSITTPVISGGKVEYREINIGDIPIAMGIFNRFLIDFVIAKKNYNVSYVDFVVSFYKFFMNKYYSKTCLDMGVGADAFSPEVKFFEMFRETNNKDPIALEDNPGKSFVFPPYLDNFGSSKKTNFQVFESMHAVKKRMNKYETNIKAGKGKDYSTHHYYSYCYLGGQTIGHQNRNWGEDLANNIHHFFIGRDRGIVKNIEFSSRDIKGRAESAYFSSNALEKGMFMIPRVYDVTVTMVGNNFFQSGQTFYVDPTLGTSLSSTKLNGQNLDMIANSGLGGYYYASKVTTVISTGKYETKLEGIKVRLSHQETKKNKVHNPATSAELKKITKKQEKLQKDLKKLGK